MYKGLTLTIVREIVARAAGTSIGMFHLVDKPFDHSFLNSQGFIVVWHTTITTLKAKTPCSGVLVHSPVNILRGDSEGAY